jgi:pantoate kinase
MKNNLATAILLGVLAVSALSSVVMCWMYISNTREIRSLQGQATLINNRRAAINSLANDCLKYSERNPAIDPILHAAGVKAPRTGTIPATNKPAIR